MSIYCAILALFVWYLRYVTAKYWTERRETKEAVVGLLGVLGWGLTIASAVMCFGA